MLYNTVGQNYNYQYRHTVTYLIKIPAEVSPDSAIKEEQEDTEEVKTLKQKRRSTIIQAKSWREMDFSKLEFGGR